MGRNLYGNLAHHDLQKHNVLSRVEGLPYVRQIAVGEYHCVALTRDGRVIIVWNITCLLLLISMLRHGQVIFESKGDKLSSSAECRIRTQRASGTESPADWMPADIPTELSRIKLKTWTRQPVHMLSEHSAHSTPLAFGIRTWLWRYTCLLLLISMLWMGNYCVKYNS